MKKRAIVLFSVCVVILLGAIILNAITSKSYLEEIKYDKLVEKINNKDSFVLLISQTICDHCKDYKPILRKVANDNKLVVYYIEFDLLTSDQKTKFKDLFVFDGTPVTVFVKNGVEETVAMRINGNSSIEKITAKFKSNGFI